MTDAGKQWSSAFAGASVDAMRVYDDILVPAMFTSWADDLVRRVGCSPGNACLDVACGPGSVARALAPVAGASGRVLAADISPAMLEIARSKPPIPGAAPIEYRESPAAPLEVPDDAFDVATCQQGLQFFPDKAAALAEIRRALRAGGTAAVSFWTAIEEQVPFRSLQQALAEVTDDDLARRYGGPWSLAGDEAADLAAKAGFDDVRLDRVELPVVFEGGAPALVATLAASGIAPQYAALGDEERDALVAATERNLKDAIVDGRIESVLASWVLVLR